MPKYDYIDSEGNVTEYEFPIGKAPKEHEGKKKMLFGTVPVFFKGGGWTKETTEPRKRRSGDWEEINRVCPKE